MSAADGFNKALYYGPLSAFAHESCVLRIRGSERIDEQVKTNALAPAIPMA